MKEFLKKLISGGDEVSSKRVISIVALILFISEVVCAYFKIVIPEYMVYQTVGLILGASTLTMFNNKSKNDITKTTTESTQTNVTTNETNTK